MRMPLIVLVLWAVVVMIATTFIPSLPLPLNALPLMLASGLVLMHRYDTFMGMAWIVLGAVAMHTLTHTTTTVITIILGIVAFVLCERVFARRSLYALIGLGICIGILRGIMLFLSALIIFLTHPGDGLGLPLSRIMENAGTVLLELIMLLYLIFGVIRTIERFLYVRQSFPHRRT